MDHARTRGVVFLEAAGIDSTGHIMGTPPGRTLQSISETIKGGVQRRNFEAQNNSKTAVAAMILLEL
jgi:hypothetical protein